MQLLDKEIIIDSADKERLIITNLRIVQQLKSGRSLFYKSIYLDDITSIAVIKKRNKLLLYFTLLTLVLGMSSMVGERIVEGVIGKETGNMAIFLGLASLFFYLLYTFLTISNISIGTSSIRIDQPINSKDNIYEFILKVEQAKLAAKRPSA